MTATTAVCLFLVVLAGGLLHLSCVNRLDRIQAWLERLAFDNAQHKLDINRIDRYLRVIEGENDYRSLSLRVHECEQKLGALVDAHNGVAAISDWLAAESVDTSALIIDHLGFEIQEPTTVTTPRRLVPKSKGGKE